METRDGVSTLRHSGRWILGDSQDECELLVHDDGRGHGRESDRENDRGGDGLMRLSERWLPRRRPFQASSLRRHAVYESQPRKLADKHVEEVSALLRGSLSLPLAIQEE